MSLESLLSQLDPANRGPQFERLCHWYLTNAPEYRGRFKRVWLWAEWPDAWGPDAGIDLVAEEHDGGLWAIQAKAYDPAYAIKKADVDSFLSESSRPQFSYRLLIATTDRLGPTAKRTLNAQREQVGYRLRSDLELAPVAWPASPDDLRQPHKNIVLPLGGPAKATFQKLGGDNTDMSFEKLQDKVDNTILLAHRMPGERVGIVKTGPLGGQQITAASRIYKDAYVRSSQEILATRINTLIEHESSIDGLKWNWTPNELDLTDPSADQDVVVKAFTANVITLNEAREKINEEPLPQDDPRGEKLYAEITGPGTSSALPPDQATLQQSNDELAASIEQMLGSEEE